MLNLIQTAANVLRNRSKYEPCCSKCVKDHQPSLPTNDDAGIDMSVGGIIAGVFLVLLTPGVPAGVIWLKHNYPERTTYVEPLITCYVCGIAIGNIISLAGEHGEGTPVYTVLDLLSSATVALGLPMLLFSTNLAALRGPAVYVAMCMLIGATCVVCMAFAVEAMVGGQLGDDAPTVAGLMTAVLTGGTPNMAAVRAALGVPAETFVAVHTAETVVGALYVLLLVTVARRGLGLCMRDYETPKATWFGGYCAWIMREVPEEDKPKTASEKAHQVEGGVQQQEQEQSEGEGGAGQGQGQGVKGPVALGPSVSAAQTAPGRDDGGPYHSLEDSKETGGVGSTGASAQAGGEEEEGTVEAVAEGEEGGTGEEAAARADALVREMEQMQENGGVGAFMEALEARFRCGLLSALGLAVVIVGVSFALGLPAGEGWSTVVTIVAISTLALVASAFKQVREIQHTFTVGEFIVLGFCFAVGALADLSQLVKTSPYVFLYVAVMMVLAIGLHLGLAALAGFDADTAIISSVSNVLSPPFVGLACRAIGNRKLMAPGVAAGLLGYALGSYLGIGVFAALGGDPSDS